MICNFLKSEGAHDIGSQKSPLLSDVLFSRDISRLDPNKSYIGKLLVSPEYQTTCIHGGFIDIPC